MKKYFIAGIIYISSIFVVRAYDETRFFVNLESPYKKNNVLVAEYNITNMPYLNNIGYENENLYATKYVFELNKNMKLKENVIYYKDEILGISTKIDDKLYGEVFTVSGNHKIENNELLKYKTETELEKIDNLNVKEMKVKVNKDKTLNFLESKDINYSLESFQNENLDENKIKDITYSERVFSKTLDKIMKEVSKNKEELNSLKNAIKIKNSKENLIIIQLIDSFGKWEKFIVADLDKNKYYLSDYKELEASFANELNKKIDYIKESIKKDNFIYLVFESGNISKIEIKGDKLIENNIYKSNKNIINCTFIDDYIYLISSDSLTAFNIKEEKEEVVLKDNRKINNGFELDFLDNKNILIRNINGGNSIIGKLEGDKINIISKINASMNYYGYIDNGNLLIYNQEGINGAYNEILYIYDINK
ncbi:hypothetical protein HMPREF1092_01964 [Clostridium thermobutyricum]|uniref:Uncharacterized protein n=1 Tax=Clostridium thermobutyricum TaxID=29372 RepID=N9WDZ8_9CLOT|nr:hypothetical protein [Clostridium thermobutyricum]ENZ01256.1 hypothetical protein HMPREF1092_01964 [Clostridium thermobutyricum]